MLTRTEAMSVTPPLVIRVQVVHIAVLMFQIMVNHLPIPFTIEQDKKDSQVNHGTPSRGSSG